MSAPRRQRAVEALWPTLTALVEKASDKERMPSGDRSLATALGVASTSVVAPGTGEILVLRPSGMLPAIGPGDDIVLEHSSPSELADLRERGAGASAEAPVFAEARKLVSAFVDFERRVLSELIVRSVDAKSTPLPSFPGGLVEAVIGARAALDKWPGAIDLLLTARDRDRLNAAKETKEAVGYALRGGSVLISSQEASGGLIAHLPGPIAIGVVEKLTLDWDLGPGSQVVLTLSTRLRYWRSEPKPKAVKLELPT